MSLSFDAYPLLMKPKLTPKVWGGSRLVNQLHPELAAEARGASEPIGESWELADHPDGASTIANGPHAGRAFGELLRAEPQGMIARPVAGRFPLLVKYIDAAEDLSIQVHPDDAKAATMTDGDRGKTEAWFVMNCDAGTRVQHGLRPGTTPAAMRAAVEARRWDDVLQYHAVRRGTFLEVPAGIVHALLGGTLICEIQQNSNTTYRLYDWDRIPARALHIEESLAVIDYAPDVPAEPVVVEGPLEAGVAIVPLTRNALFSVEAVRVAPGAAFAWGGGRREAVIANIVGGEGHLCSEHATESKLALRTGQTYFLPAALDRARFEAGAAELVVLLTRSFEL